jgi:hypothetical protein
MTGFISYVKNSPSNNTIPAWRYDCRTMRAPKNVERGMFPQHVRRNGEVQWPARSPGLFVSTSFGATLKVKCPQLFLGPQANTEEISVIPEEIMRRALGKPSIMTEKVLEKWRKAFQRRIFF